MRLWLYYLCAFFAIILIRYFVVAGGTFWLFYSSSNLNFIVQNKKLKQPSRQSIEKDIILSVITTLALSICASSIMTVYNSGATRLYSSIDDYGIAYLIVSFLGVILLQDTCYYFIHRAFHHHSLYKWLHSGHHKSKDPTPWTSFAMDFPEALIQGLFMIAVVCIIPLHFYILVLLLITMTIWALVNHLGFELFPNFPNHWLGRWFISSDHHSLHHRQHTRHFGLYFTFWDWLLGTD